MKKIVVFTEGRGELIFLRHILIKLIGLNDLSFECFSLISDELRNIPYPYINVNAPVHYLIINVGTDERVLSAIEERYEGYLSRGYEIIGLRDMYCKRYQERSPTYIAQDANDYFRNSSEEYVQRFTNPEKIHFFFSIMELEAWLLGLYCFLERLDPLLTTENINNQLGFNLEAIDPETTFYHPAIDFGRILNLANINYDKHIGQMESIVSHITLDDINRLLQRNRCSSFALLYKEIEREFYESIST